MHSSPFLALLLSPRRAAAFVLVGALVGLGCQESIEPGASQAQAPAAAASTARDAEASAPSTGMTRVGAPSGASGTKAPAQEDAAAPNPPDPMRAEPSTPSTSAAPDLTCSADNACKTVDSMCGSCRCLILPAQMKPPACSEPEVTCLVAPCLNKRAVCSAAMCALQDQGPNAM